MKYAVIKNNEIRCPECGKKIANITGNETIKNFIIRCPRKICGKSHEYIINL